jgi:hypothetical protein
VKKPNRVTRGLDYLKVARENLSAALIVLPSNNPEYDDLARIGRELFEVMLAIDGANTDA